MTKKTIAGLYARVHNVSVEEAQVQLNIRDAERAILDSYIDEMLEVQKTIDHHKELLAALKKSCMDDLGLTAKMVAQELSEYE